MVLALVVAAVVGQVPIAAQPDFADLLATVKEARARRPLDEKALLAIKQGPIEPTLAADLSALDWYLPGAWSYPEKKFGVTWFDDEVFQYDLRRHLADGQQLSFSLSVNLKTKTSGQLTHTNFTLPSPLVAKLKKVGAETYLELVAYGASELHRVVQYEKGVLVLDVSYDGKPKSKKVKFRDVWIAMPRKFESTGT